MSNDHVHASIIRAVKALELPQCSLACHDLDVFCAIPKLERQSLMADALTRFVDTHGPCSAGRPQTWI